MYEANIHYQVPRYSYCKRRHIAVVEDWERGYLVRMLGTVLFEGGVYFADCAATIRGRRPFEEIRYLTKAV